MCLIEGLAIPDDKKPRFEDGKSSRFLLLVEFINILSVMMRSLFGIDSDVLVAVLAEWTVVTDLARLDSAFCNFNCRSQFLALVALNYFDACNYWRNEMTHTSHDNI